MVNLYGALGRLALRPSGNLPGATNALPAEARWLQVVRTQVHAGFARETSDRTRYLLVRAASFFLLEGVALVTWHCYSLSAQ
jgi:hypothetical protein